LELRERGVLGSLLGHVRVIGRATRAPQVLVCIDELVGSETPTKPGTRQIALFASL